MTDYYPAIRTYAQYVDDFRGEQIRQILDDTQFARGHGRYGQRIHMVDRDCPLCEHDHMARWWDVNPVSENVVEYWCLNPGCQHWFGDSSRESIARSKGGYWDQPKTPVVYTLSVTCPDCGDRHVIENDRRVHPDRDTDSEVLCEDCKVLGP